MKTVIKRRKFIAGFLMILAWLLCIAGLTGCGDTGLGQTSAQTVETSLSTEAESLSEDGSNAEDSLQEDDSYAEDFPSEDGSNAGESLSEDGSYTSKEDVALYLHLYGKLPENYITKKEAKNLGWEGGELEPYAPGKSIGGDRFGNYEGLLPETDGRTYYECDIDTQGKKRGAKRIVYSNDGLIYYTEDHYETFTLLYGEDR